MTDKDIEAVARAYCFANKWNPDWDCEGGGKLWESYKGDSITWSQALQSLGWQSPSESTAENTALLVALADIRIKTGVGATPMLTELAEAIASKQKAEVEAARVAAQREAFARAKHAFLAETKKWIDPNGSPEKQYANDVAFRVLDKLRALSPSPGPWQRVPEGTPIEDAAIWAREKAAMKRPFDEVDLELQAELQKDCLSDLDKAHAMISEVKP